MSTGTRARDGLQQLAKEGDDEGSTRAVNEHIPGVKARALAAQLLYPNTPGLGKGLAFRERKYLL